jgi:hypothetical protein
MSLFFIFFLISIGPHCTTKSGTNVNPYEVISDDAVTVPNASTVWTLIQENVTIQWMTDDLGSKVRIELYKSSELIMVIINSTLNDGEYAEFDVPLSIEPDNVYRVKVISLDDERRYDFSNYFKIIISSEPVGYVNLKYTDPLIKNILFTYSEAEYDNENTVEPHWKITRKNGYMRFRFAGKVAFRFHVRGNPYDENHFCDISMSVNGVTYWEKRYIEELWDHYVIPASEFVADHNQVTILLADWEDLWIDKVEIGDYTPDTSFVVLQPDASTLWTQSQQDVRIRWDPGSLKGNISIALMRGTSFHSVIVKSTSNDGGYDDFDIPSDITPAWNYLIQINHKETTGIWDNGEMFEIKAK